MSTTDELTAADFEGATFCNCECESCGQSTHTVNVNGMWECRDCLASNYLKGEAETSEEAARWARWTFEGAES